MYGFPTFLQLLDISSDAADHATYDIGHVAGSEDVGDTAWNRIKEAISFLLRYSAHQREELMEFHNVVQGC